MCFLPVSNVWRGVDGIDGREHDSTAAMSRLDLLSMPRFAQHERTAAGDSERCASGMHDIGNAVVDCAVATAMP